MRSVSAAVWLMTAGVLAIGALSETHAQTATHGMVVSEDSLASDAGIAVLRAGGNAVDAAVAVGFVLAVTYPEAGNIGGGGYMLIRPAQGKPRVIDFRERAPRTASPGMFLDSLGNPVPERSLRGPLASGVPGTPAGLVYALRRFGTKSLKQVMRRAITLAERGFPVDGHLAGLLREYWREFSRWPSTTEIFAHEGIPLKEGDTLRQKDLSATLRLIVRKGSDGFYRGPVAAKIAEAINKGGGLITGADLAAYRPIERDPVHGSYRGYTILSAGPSSSGGIVLLEILNMLEPFDLHRYGQNSETAIHLFASAAQRAYADRSEFLGDPAYVSIPVKKLISKRYAHQRAGSIDTLYRSPSSSIHAGTVEGHVHTTHYCVIDSRGNAVSVTYTLNELFGNGIIVRGAGFFLNDEMDDFAVKPGVPNLFGLTGGEANSIRPGKRMLSTMSPTIVLKNNRPYLILGARGGSRIATSVAEVIMNVIDFGLRIDSAVAAPRTHFQWLPDSLYVESGIQPSVIAGLSSMGYACSIARSGIARVEALMVDPETRIIRGAPDPRGPGFATGY